MNYTLVVFYTGKMPKGSRARGEPSRRGTELEGSRAGGEPSRRGAEPEGSRAGGEPSRRGGEGRGGEREAVVCCILKSLSWYACSYVVNLTVVGHRSDPVVNVSNDMHVATCVHGPYHNDGTVCFMLMQEAVRLAEELREQGNDHFKCGKSATALKHYEEALYTCERYHLKDLAVKLHGNIAAVYLREQQYETAYGHAEECIQLDRGFPKVNVSCVIALIASGHVEILAVVSLARETIVILLCSQCERYTVLSLDQETSNTVVLAQETIAILLCSQCQR